MTLAKITVSGKITKNPEKRFTQNNLPVTSFVMDINPQDETLVRVLSLGALAERSADNLKLGDTVIVDGRLQTNTAKSTNGKEKRIIEINASTVEKVTFENEGTGYSGNTGSSNYRAQAPQASAPQNNAKSSDIVQFAVEEISEDLIDEDEIPF